MDIMKMAESCNNKHNDTAVHITYFERLEHIREIMPSYKKKLIKSFLKTEMDDETLAESLMTLSQSILTIETDESLILLLLQQKLLHQRKRKTLIEYQQQPANTKNILITSKKLLNISSEIWFSLLKHYHLSIKQYYIV